MTETRISYCVVCRFKLHPETVRIVGPFETQDEAAEWAMAMRGGNDAWHYHADVMQQPTKLTAAPPDDDRDWATLTGSGG